MSTTFAVSRSRTWILPACSLKLIDNGRDELGRLDDASMRAPLQDPGVYAIDEVGKVLDYVTTIDVSSEAREPRNGTPTEPTALASLRAMHEREHAR